MKIAGLVWIQIQVCFRRASSQHPDKMLFFLLITYNYVFLIPVIVLGAFLCPLITCSEFGQKLFDNLKSVLLKLDFGIRAYINQKLKERAGKLVAGFPSFS